MSRYIEPPNNFTDDYYNQYSRYSETLIIYEDPRKQEQIQDIRKNMYYRIIDDGDKDLNGFFQPQFSPVKPKFFKY